MFLYLLNWYTLLRVANHGQLQCFERDCYESQILMVSNLS